MSTVSKVAFDSKIRPASSPYFESWGGEKMCVSRGEAAVLERVGYPVPGHPGSLERGHRLAHNERRAPPSTPVGRFRNASSLEYARRLQLRPNSRHRVDDHVTVGGNGGFGLESDGEPCHAEHRQIVRPVTHGDRVLEGEPQLTG